MIINILWQVDFSTYCHLNRSYVNTLKNSTMFKVWVLLCVKLKVLFLYIISLLNTILYFCTCTLYQIIDLNALNWMNVICRKHLKFSRKMYTIQSFHNMRWIGEILTTKIVTIMFNSDFKTLFLRWTKCIYWIRSGRTLHFLVSKQLLFSVRSLQYL